MHRPTYDIWQQDNLKQKAWRKLQFYAIEQSSDTLFIKTDLLWTLLSVHAIYKLCSDQTCYKRTSCQSINVDYDPKVANYFSNMEDQKIIK